jgi:HEAT repeat protein
MKRWKRHKALCLRKKRQGSRSMFLIVILMALFGQVAAQNNTDKVTDLIKQLKSQDAGDRLSAARALGEMGPEAKQAIPALLEALMDQSYFVRENAAIVLRVMGPEAIPELIEALKGRNDFVSGSAANVLAQIGPKAIPALTEALKGQNDDLQRGASFALAGMGPEAIPALTEMLKDQNQFVRHRAGDALSVIATRLFDSRSTEYLQELKTAYAVSQTYNDMDIYAADVKRTIVYFESLWWVKLWDSVERLVRNYPLISILVAAYLVLQIIWLLLLWLRPLLLLKVITSLGQVGEKFKIPKLDIPIPIRPLLVFPLFYYRSRLLDAWVRSNLLTARENFINKQTVAQRKVYVAMPASINEKISDSISVASFQSILNKSKLTILIAGEGGAGKTSLACQMALWAMEDDPHERLCKDHRMLPVLIESNLDARSDGKNALVETVHGQLGDLMGLTEPIPKELFVKLLRKRRVLVILDSLSELDEATHKSVRPAQSDFPIAALVVTSRIDEDLGGAAKTTVRPVRLKSNSLSTFLHEYLTRCGKRGLFEDDEFFDDCRCLSQIVGEREITVLIARLYADLMIAKKEQPSDHDLPQNLPDLMQGYVKNLNDKIKTDKLDTDTVLRAAKIIADKCLAQTYRPSPAKRDEVLKALNTETDAKALLKYLEERIQIIQTTGAVGDRIRFSLDPLAEYLTGMYLVENYGQQENRWQGFIDSAKGQPGAPEAIKGFLLAVRDCCVDKVGEYDVPEKIKDELALLAGLDPEEVNAAHLKQRIRRLIANLKLPDADDRETAADMLGNIGPGAKSAIPALIMTLKGDDDSSVRSSTAYALGEMGPEAKQAITALTEALKDQSVFVRESALRALGAMGPVAIPALIEALKDQSEDIRIRAALALGNIGPEAKQAIPVLTEALKDENEYVRQYAAEVIERLKSV